MPEHVNITVGYLDRDVDLHTATTRRTTLQDPKTLDISYASDVAELMGRAIEALGLAHGDDGIDIASKEYELRWYITAKQMIAAEDETQCRGLPLYAILYRQTCRPYIWPALRGAIDLCIDRSFGRH